MPIFYSVFSNEHFTQPIYLPTWHTTISDETEWETEHAEKWNVINKSELFHIRKLQTK